MTASQFLGIDPSAGRFVYPALELRERAALVLASLDGLGSNPGRREQLERYLALVAPGEARRQAEAMGRMSGCGLVASGFWLAMGVVHRDLKPPYVIGTAVSRLVEIGREADAIRRPSGVDLDDPARALGALPEAGDVVWIGEGVATHVYVAIESGLRGGAPVVYALDGGQRDRAGFQLVACREHAWMRGHKNTVNETARALEVGTSWGGVRKVQGWIDLEAVVARFG